MNSELADKIIAIVANTKRVAPETIRPEATFEELGIDSLDRINILFEVENEFNIDVPDEEVRTIKTVNDMIERLNAFIQQQKGAEA